VILIQILIMPPVPDERPNDLVDARYVAARSGCSVSSVRSHKCNTQVLMRVSNNPLRFRRGDVDKAVRELAAKAATNTPMQKAIRLLNRKGKKREAS
jgi:hypothetical protein